MGKNFGGAVGMAFEGWPGPRLSAAAPSVPSAVPNDDFEMQLMALAAIERSGRWPEPEEMARIWQDHLGFAPDEYGVALRNLREGILPPASGATDNFFAHGMGAVIRSELWACLCPDDPEAAATLAANDAGIDHAGEGVLGAAFLAALQSAAFGGADLEQSIAAAASLLPMHSVLPDVVSVTGRLAMDNVSDEDAIRACHETFGSANFTDCIMNLAFILLALRRGSGDVMASLHFALRCGEDADCTCASVGATLGILHGPPACPAWEGSSERLAISPDFLALDPPRSLSELVDRVGRLRDRMRGQPVAAWPSCQPLKPYPHTWLVVAASDALDEPSAIQELVSKPDRLSSAIRSFNGYCGTLTGQSPVAWHLLSHITLSEDFDGWLLLVAEAGLTAWIDGRILLNCHNRKPIIPAFHRTEGGASVAIQLKAHHQYKLHIRLLHPQCSARFVVALADFKGHYVPNFRFRYVTNSAGNVASCGS